MIRIFLGLALFCGLAMVPAVMAQTTANSQETPKKLAPIEDRIQSDMIAMSDMAQALSRNLGQLHYLRTLCFGQNDQKWRGYAQKMMDIESGTDSEKRRILIKAFNDGYYDQKARFPKCTDSVSVDAAALSENARQLSQMLGDPYRE